jgi:hypothetical protein
MENLQEMFFSHSKADSYELKELQQCMQDCFMCADYCIVCADACLHEEMVSGLVNCIKLNQDCADICEATGKLLLRASSKNINLIKKQLEACKLACMICAEECASHSSRHKHCKLCSDMCMQCVSSCQELLNQIG